MNIRTYIKDNLKECSKEDIKETISASISPDESKLPGLGVLFEILWKYCNNDERDMIAKILFESTKKA